ncbi:hypothetical protein [Streptomyces sp. NPDC050428]|uniref:hypothetical protein n=1 Tax=Streptomyces sp. NPDC050428 TaxID=3155757 RepID=UPI00342A822F
MSVVPLQNRADAANRPLPMLVITETRVVTVIDTTLLLRAADHIADFDPDSASAVGYKPGPKQSVNAAVALLLADADAADIAERAPRLGLRLVSASTLATDALTDNTVYEKDVET